MNIVHSLFVNLIISCTMVVPKWSSNKKKHYILYKYRGNNIVFFFFFLTFIIVVPQYFLEALWHTYCTKCHSKTKHGIAPQYIFYHAKKHGISMVPV